MDQTKYIGMDVHKETISIAVLSSSGKWVMESVIETRASTVVQFVPGLRGDLHVTLEEGTWAAWLYDLLRPHVVEAALPGSFDRSDPRGSADRDPADPTPLPHQAAAVGLRRSGDRDAQQRRSSLCRWTAATLEAAGVAARAQSQSQPRAEKHLQGRSRHRRHQAWTVPGVLRSAGGQRNEAGDGPTHPGTKDCRHHLDRLEERSLVRRPTSETTNSLSVSGVRSIVFQRWSVGSGDARVRERVSAVKLGAACLGRRVSQTTLGPLGQPEKAIGHESPIEPWLAPDHRFALRVSELIGFVAAGDENRW